MKKQFLLLASLLICTSAVPVFAGDAPKASMNNEAMPQAAPTQKDMKKEAMSKPAAAEQGKKNESMKQDSKMKDAAPARDTNKSMMYKY